MTWRGMTTWLILSRTFIFCRPVKTCQSPKTRHFYLLCELPKTCFGVQLSGFPFRTISLHIRCHRTGSEVCSGNHLPQHRLRGQLGPQWNFKAKRQAFKSM